MATKIEVAEVIVEFAEVKAQMVFQGKDIEVPGLEVLKEKDFD
jgi:hypothetical protein